MANDITDNLSTTGTDPYAYSSPPAADTPVNNDQAQVDSTPTDTSTDINELIKNDPQLQALYDQIVASNKVQTPAQGVSIQRIIAALIELSQVLQSIALSETTRLGIITDKINAYATLQSNIPIITANQGYFTDDDKGRANRQDTNQSFGLDLQTLQANSGLEQDASKKVQTLMQTMKDAGTSVEDFIGSFIDLLRGISSKITQ